MCIADFSTMTLCEMKFLKSSAPLSVGWSVNDGQILCVWKCSFCAAIIFVKEVDHYHACTWATSRNRCFCRWFGMICPMHCSGSF